jgi:hypothetical protein
MGTLVSNLLINIIRIPSQFLIAIFTVLLLIAFAPLALFLYLFPATKDFGSGYMRKLYTQAIFLIKTIKYSQYIKIPVFITLDELIEIENGVS